MQSPQFAQLQEIYDNKDNYSNDELTQKAKQELEAIDYTKFTYKDIEAVEKLKKLPIELVNKIFKGFMRRQDELLLNIRGNLLYQPLVKKDVLGDFFEMLRCPTPGCNNNLVVKDILRKIHASIASNGENQNNSDFSLINDKKFNDGVIKFDQSQFDLRDSNNSPRCLLDFKNETYYHNLSSNQAHFIIGLPPFMRVKLTSYKLRGPPKIGQRDKQGGPKSWVIDASNDWDKIKNDAVRIHAVQNDTHLKNPDDEHEFDVELEDDQYYRYFKFTLNGENHQGEFGIYLSCFDISGVIEICEE